MSQPDTKVLSFPETPRKPRRVRDPRIDAFRGLALLMIFVNHMPGVPYEGLTSRNWGFSDAAEGFFIMSGIAAGLAYSGRFLTPGLFLSGAVPMWRRAWTLYLAHLLLTLWAIVIFAGGADLFGDPELMEMHNLPTVFDHPEEAIFGLATLGHQIGYVNILPSYCVILLAAPLAIRFGERRPGLVLALSGAVWLVAGAVRLNFPNYFGGGGWAFNPFAWQFIFVIGLMTGMAARRGEALVPRSPVLMWICGGFLILSFLWMHIPPVGAMLNRGMWLLGQAGLPSNLVSHDKVFLALPRLAHALALAYLLSALPVVRKACATDWAAPLRLMGRQGLLVFCAGTLMALTGQVILHGLAPQVWPGWVLPPVGLSVLLAIAWLADRSRNTPAPVPPVSVPGPQQEHVIGGRESLAKA
ncbi:OpgC family protein [Pseudooceanicola sp. C21-150M6]|uniref:OpgC family protein n=1 Tax=Pseudooceanicola sp. C21-150M6 TaxID=3434355 RepID=UPI003D7FD651